MVQARVIRCNVSHMTCANTPRISSTYVSCTTHKRPDSGLSQPDVPVLAAFGSRILKWGPKKELWVRAPFDKAANKQPRAGHHFTEEELAFQFKAIGRMQLPKVCFLTHVSILRQISLLLHEHGTPGLFCLCSVPIAAIHAACPPAYACERGDTR